MTRFFTLKAWLGGAGLTLGLVGMAIGQRWIVWIAATLMGVAFGLRFAERRREPPP